MLRKQWSKRFLGGWPFLSDRGDLEPVGIELPCEVLVKPVVHLRVGWFSGFRQTIQEVGRYNCPPCL